MKIGIIGMGDMGQLYTRVLTANGYETHGIDLPSNTSNLKRIYQDNPLVRIHDVPLSLIEASDYVLFCVETKNIDSVVKKFADLIPAGKIVGGQTSVKHPEISAFDKYLSEDVEVITIHPLHGPQVDPAGQTLVAIPHRCSDESLQKVLSVLTCTGSKIEVLPDVETHDKMMADIQVVTHIGFESIGTSFMHRGVFPWENPLLNSGLDNLKLLLTLRIFSYKHHVYSGLAMMNPYSGPDVRTYAKAENDLFGLMISEEKEEFISLVMEAKKKVFRDFTGKLMLNDELMAEFSLNPSNEHKPNSHLSLLAMVLTWARLDTNPYKNLICQTPPFKLRVGMAEYLFLNETLLEESLNAALYDKSIRKDDLAFHTSVQEWAHIVEIGDSQGYEAHFRRTKTFLADRLEEGRRLSTTLIERLNNEKS